MFLVDVESETVSPPRGGDAWPPVGADECLSEGDDDLGGSTSSSTEDNAPLTQLRRTDRQRAEAAVSPRKSAMMEPSWAATGLNLLCGLSGPVPPPPGVDEDAAERPGNEGPGAVGGPPLTAAGKLKGPKMSALEVAQVNIKRMYDEYLDDSDASDISYGTWLFDVHCGDPVQAVLSGRRRVRVRELCLLPTDVILGYSRDHGWFRASVSRTRLRRMRAQWRREPGSVLYRDLVDGPEGTWLSFRPYASYQQPLRERDLGAALARWAIEWWHLSWRLVILDPTCVAPVHVGNWDVFVNAIARNFEFLVCPIHFAPSPLLDNVGEGHWGLLLVDLPRRTCQYLDSTGNEDCAIAMETMVARGGGPLAGFGFDVRTPMPMQRSGITCGHRLLTWVRWLLHYFSRYRQLPTQRVPGYSEKLTPF